MSVENIFSYLLSYFLNPHGFQDNCNTLIFYQTYQFQNMMSQLMPVSRQQHPLNTVPLIYFYQIYRQHLFWLSNFLLQHQFHNLNYE